MSNTTSTSTAATTDTANEVLDVLIVGAGISGIGMAYHLQQTHPGRSYAILEGREEMGGTWSLFKYPGIRSDSDLPTFGYKFKPWTGKQALADGHAILDYLNETASENGIDKHIRYGHRVIKARFDSEAGTWKVDVAKADGEQIVIEARWLLGATGYYRYDEGYTPEFAGREDFKGQIIHPQHWPEDLDYTGKKVVVIGSGATAVTLIPSMVKGGAGHVTMLQRSPSYILSIPEQDPIANKLRDVLGDERGHKLARKKNIAMQRLIFNTSRKRPELVKKLIRGFQEKQLPEGYDIDKHLTPKYNPWDQRLCMVPNGDLFKAIRDGDAAIATDTIEKFTETGIQLDSGEHLDADIIITATGLNLLAFGGIEMEVDGEEVVPNDCVAYMGMMLSGVPNFAFAIGYTNASWTLKVDLVGEYLGRLFSHMDRTGKNVCVPQPQGDLQERPLLDFAAGYVQRSISSFPTQGDRYPWQLTMDYDKDVPLFNESPVYDNELEFTKAGEATKTDKAPALVG